MDPARALRTRVRLLAVRRRSYLTNTCSPQRPKPSLRSARSVLYAWPARSCCSRTTTTSTGRSTRTSAPVYLTRTERRCAEGAPSVVSAKCRHGRRRACVLSGAAATLSTSGSACAVLSRWGLPHATAVYLPPRGLPESTSTRRARRATRAVSPRTADAQRRRAARRRPVYRKNRRRPTLPGPCGPSTIGAEGLNCSVRNGKRCFPLAKATGKRRKTTPPTVPQNYTVATNEYQKIRQALDPLVPVSFARCRTSRSGLSTWWSTRGLTPSRGWESSS
jgi:hypothetical protein